MRGPAVAAAIVEAFPDRALPLQGIATWEAIPEGEDAEIALRLGGRTWKSLSTEEVAVTPACFFTTDALAIVIPAFLLERLAASDRFFRVREMQLMPGSDDDHRVYSLAERLTLDQVSAVVEFLAFAAGERDSEASAALPIWQGILESRSESSQ